MAIFNFGRKQNLGVDLYGHTSGKEMFLIDEYNQRKGFTLGLILILSGIFTIFYFGWDGISNNIKFFFGLVFLGLGIVLYFNLKNQIKMREDLY